MEKVENKEKRTVCIQNYLRLERIKLIDVLRFSSVLAIDFRSYSNRDFKNEDNTITYKYPSWRGAHATTHGVPRRGQPSPLTSYPKQPRRGKLCATACSLHQLTSPAYIK